jgi:hypothetical protein
MGYRGRGSRGFYLGNGPFQDIPPWQRPGWVYGTGSGTTGAGDSYSCMRFPWLPRRWWTYPEATTGEAILPSAKQSKQIIEKQIAAAEEHIAALRRRLGELEPREKTN